MTKKNNEIPEHVSWRVQDAWLAIPPCNYSDSPYCHVDCPYHYECYPEYYDDYDEEECCQVQAVQ